MSNDPFTFTPEERGFERVSDDDSDALYATDESRDATGNVDREEFAVRGGQGDRRFAAQKIQLDDTGKIIGKKTFGRARNREKAKERVESRVRRTTSANFGGFEIGEFNVGNERNITDARQAHLSRSEEAQASDAAKRAPVTTDASRYASQPGELDYPGVDTPSTDPNVLPKDLRQKQRPATTDPPDPPTPRRDNDVSNPANDSILLEEEAEAGLGLDVGREIRNPANVPVTPGSERRDSMVADGMGGVRFNANVGAYRETDRPDEEQTPPDIARGEDPFDIAASTVEDVFSEDEKDRLQDEFETATNQFDEIGTDDASDFLDEAAFRKAQLPSLETGDTLATNTTNTLLSARRAER